MAITNTEAIRFTNEVVRVKAEQLRALKAEVDAVMAAWFGGINTLIPNDAGEALSDGRENEGVSRLNGADINSLVAQLAGIQTALDVEGVAGVISKPCVRALRAE
jgi:hypothetical protein